MTGTTTIAGRYRIEGRLGVGGMSTVHLAFDQPARALRGAQAARRAPRRRPDVRLALPPRSARGRAPRSPEHRPGVRLRLRRGPPPALHRHGARRRPLVRRAAARPRAPRRRPGRRDRLPGLSRPRLRAPQRGHPPRRQARATCSSPTSDVVKLADFGIARATDQSSITQVGSVLGTAAYLAPEQARGEEAGPRADIYSLGVVTYQLLSGRLPYEANSLSELALMQQREAPDPAGLAEPRRAARAGPGGLDGTRDRPGGAARSTRRCSRETLRNGYQRRLAAPFYRPDGSSRNGGRNPRHPRTARRRRLRPASRRAQPQTREVPPRSTQRRSRPPAQRARTRRSLRRAPLSGPRRAVATRRPAGRSRCSRWRSCSGRPSPPP